MPNNCPAITGKGEPRQGFVHPSKTYCPSHDPERVEARKRAASIAGRSKPGSEISEVKRQLRKLADDVLAGRQSRADASVVSQVLGVWLKACETEIREREAVVRERELVEIRLPEFQTLAQEVAQLRELVETKGTSRRGSWAG